MGPGNGLVAVWHQTITWTNGHLLAIGPLVANYSEIAMKTLNIFSRKWIRECCLQDVGNFVYN